MNWKTEGVKIIRAEAYIGRGRATVFDFVGSGGQQVWIGTVSLQPSAETGAHHHGRHEVAIYIVKGHGEIRWGERLEYRAEIGPGDFVYFAPYVPHQERNLSAGDLLDLVSIRSDGERIAEKLDIMPVEQPETVL